MVEAVEPHEHDTVRPRLAALAEVSGVDQVTDGSHVQHTQRLAGVVVVLFACAVGGKPSHAVAIACVSQHLGCRMQTSSNLLRGKIKRKWEPRISER